LALAIAREKGQHCKGKSKLEFSLDRLDEVSFPEASFNVVVCIDVFSELSDVPRILANMHRWLKPGGMLIGNFVAEEVFVRYAVERHGIVKRQLMALRHYLGISFSFTPLTYPLYDYFGEKGYTRLMPYREHEIRAVLAPHFDLLHRDTGLYHWFAAQRKA
jgi:ubiquinone/menaquinone biosynthesis C-methylase UbiE